MRPGPAAALLAAILAAPPGAAAGTWRGLEVAPEARCAPYDRRDYPYPRSVERRIVAAMGGRIYGPYEGRAFGSMRETDIEHMVAAAEAHDSGLCAATAAARRRFASDLLNLTLASPEVNRREKRDRDAADWLPRFNKCWFAGRVVQVRRKHGLTIDRREADALERVLSKCSSTEIRFVEAPAPAGAAREQAPAAARSGALRRWDDDRNGRITCREARRHGIAPVPRGHSAYPFMRDGDGDGVVCE